MGKICMKKFIFRKIFISLALENFLRVEMRKIHIWRPCATSRAFFFVFPAYFPQGSKIIKMHKKLWLLGPGEKKWIA